MTTRHGLFVVIDGPSGVGKTTVTRLIQAELTCHGLAVAATREPSDSALGVLTRHGTNDYRVCPGLPGRRRPLSPPRTRRPPSRPRSP
ncbi:dTMP kinase [Micromonospora sp. CPCC 206061]|uniref:dTMP kinase n=1 Tax=Micromonospora sp. CPCC 206061 TaxID=3122410 RepID=UPI002FF3717D